MIVSHPYTREAVSTIKKKDISLNRWSFLQISTSMEAKQV